MDSVKTTCCKREKDQTEKWLISQLAMCRREINIYRNMIGHPSAGPSIDHMKRCIWNYEHELKKHRQRNGIIHA